MPKRIKARKTQRWNGLIYFALFLSLSAIIFFAFKSFASEIIFDAAIEKFERVGDTEQVVVDFNQPVSSISLDNIEIDPFVGFSYDLSQDRTKLTIVPNERFAVGQKYTITLKNIKAFAGLPVGGEKLTFYTEKEKAKVAVGEEAVVGQVFSELTMSPKKYVPPATSTAKKTVEFAPHYPEGKYIDVSISKQLMTLFEDGVQTSQFKISSGKVGMPTPLGEFKVLSKETNHWSTKYKLWMPYSMNFAAGGYYIHELPYWPNGYREGESHLGYRVSHGCVRLGIGPAAYVFNWAPIGTPIYIHN